jgi:hypothetical protein
MNADREVYCELEEEGWMQTGKLTGNWRKNISSKFWNFVLRS